jgi:hypothetical protein
VRRRVKIGGGRERDVIAGGECLRAHGACAIGGRPIRVCFDASDVMMAEGTLDLTAERQRLRATRHASCRGSVNTPRVRWIPRVARGGRTAGCYLQLLDERLLSGRCMDRTVAMLPDAVAGLARRSGRICAIAFGHQTSLCPLRISCGVRVETVFMRPGEQRSPRRQTSSTTIAAYFAVRRLPRRPRSPADSGCCVRCVVTYASYGWVSRIDATP